MIAWKTISSREPARAPTGIKVFVSYGHGESETAAYIAQVLQAHGLDAWLDTAKLRTGSKLSEEIVREIGSSRYFLPLLSPHYLASPWCIKEFETAAAKKIDFTCPVTRTFTSLGAV
jgi:TIR domain